LDPRARERAHGLHLLTLSVVAGLVVKSKPLGTRLRPATAVDLHRFLALLGLGFLALHGVALVLDATVEVNPLALVVPGLIDYRPLPTALGVLAGDLMVLVYVSFALRRWIGQRNWRRLHSATYGVFAAATLHGLLAGTDAGTPWACGLYLGALGAVGLATAWRAFVPPGRPAPVPKGDT